MPRIIEITPSRADQNRARLMAAELAATCQDNHGTAHLPKSFTGGKSTPHGMLLEVGMDTCYGSLWRHSAGREIYDYDRVHPILRRIDIKAKVCTSPPKLNFLGSVADTRESGEMPDCDWFFHGRVLEDFSKIYICGVIPKDLFAAFAFYGHKGEREEPNNPHNLFCFAEDCWNVPYSRMFHPPQTADDFQLLLEEAQQIRDELAKIQKAKAAKCVSLT